MKRRKNFSKRRSAELKRRLFPKKRRVSGAKTSSFESKDFVFSGQLSICLQDIEIQSFAKPLNTRKISSKFPSGGKL